MKRETARRPLLHQQGELLAAIHQCEAAARQHLVNTLAMNDDAHKYNVQVCKFGNSNTKPMRDFPQDKGMGIAILSGSKPSS